MENFNSSPEFYLVTTDHLEEAIWFKDDDDYRMGMNLVATLHWILHIDIMAFILMSNHVHFVLSCIATEARRFIDEFKRRYSIYIRNKYGIKEMLRRNAIDIRPLSLSDESFERALAYTLMNCVAAGICLQPGDYPWGSGSAYFRVKGIEGTPLSSLSMRKIESITHSRIRMAGNYMVTDDGVIDPASYINTRFVESAFRTPKRMNYYLQNSSKARIRLQSESDNMPAFRDQLLSASLPDLCQSLFRKWRVEELTDLQKGELLRQLRFRFSANINQLCRVTGIRYESATELIDRV